MRIVLVHPNYHSGGAEIAGSWPPAWVAYLAGHLKDAGFDGIECSTWNARPDDAKKAREVAERMLRNRLWRTIQFSPRRMSTRPVMAVSSAI